MTKMQVREGRVYSAYTSTLLFTTRGSQDRNSHRAGTWRPELMQSPWRGAAYWLAPHGLLSLLSYRTQDYQPSNGATHNGPSQAWSPIEKMPYSWISWRHFLKGSFILCDNSTLCQVDRQNQPLYIDMLGIVMDCRYYSWEKPFPFDTVHSIIFEIT